MTSCLQLNLFNDCSRGTTAEWYFDFTFVYKLQNRGGSGEDLRNIRKAQAKSNRAFHPHENFQVLEIWGPGLMPAAS